MATIFLFIRVKPGFTPRPPFPQILIEGLLYICVRRGLRRWEIQRYTIQTVPDPMGLTIAVGD